VRSPCLTALAAIFCLLPPQTFRSGAEGVRVDVLVLDGKNPVGGLTAADFELRDSGIVQTIDSISMEDVPLSLMLALDTSRSVEGAPLAHLKDAVSAVIRLLGPADRAALTTFSAAVALRTPWTSDRATLEAGIAAAEASGATSLYDAAYAALTLRDHQPGRQLVLIFSDGDDTASWLPGSNVIEIAKRNEPVVYAVELAPKLVFDSTSGPLGQRTGPIARPDPGYRLDFHSGIQDRVENAPNAILLRRFLDELADETGGKVVNAESSERLRETFVQVINEFRSRYLLTYTPRGVNARGWHPIEVKLKNRRGQVTARRGYLR
jgi:VWFA-related protein